MSSIENSIISVEQLEKYELEQIIHICDSSDRSRISLLIQVLLSKGLITPQDFHRALNSNGSGEE